MHRFCAYCVNCKESVKGSDYVHSCQKNNGAVRITDSCDNWRERNDNSVNEIADTIQNAVSELESIRDELEAVDYDDITLRQGLRNLESAIDNFTILILEIEKNEYV